MAKHAKSYSRFTKGGPGSSLALASQCILLLAACSSDAGTKPLNQLSAGSSVTGSAGVGTGTAGKGAAATGAAATGAAGTGAAATGAAATGAAAVGVPVAGTTGAAGSTGTADAGTAGMGGNPGDITVAGASGSAGGIAGASGAAGGAPTTNAPSCLDGITNYEDAGPFKFTASAIGAVKVWAPMVPAGCKVPIVHLANGTGATCSAYQASLERLASHGFLTCCYEDTNTGAGTQGIMAIDAVMKMFPDLWDKKIGSTGHSQGGQAAFTVLQLAEAKYTDGFTFAGLAMEPASGFGTQPAGGSWQSVYGMIKSPMFMFSGDSSGGTSDGLVSIMWVQQGFDALAKTVEAYHWTGIGATHIPVPNPQEIAVSIPWFRWKLLGDQAACKFFKAMPMDTAAMVKFKVQKEQNAAPCM